jgi:hypothetical protein
MKRFRSAVVTMLALAVLLFACSASRADDAAKPAKTDDAAKPAKKKKKGDKPFAGTVVEVTQDKDKEAGTLKVSIKGNKKKNIPASEKTLKVTADTKIQKGGKKKTQTPAETVKFSTLAKDQRVRIKTKGDSVELITILPTKGKKKKNA